RRSPWRCRRPRPGPRREWAWREAWPSSRRLTLSATRASASPASLAASPAPARALGQRRARRRWSWREYGYASLAIPSEPGARSPKPGFRDPDSRTKTGDSAIAAARKHRPADVLAPGDEIQVDEWPPAAVGRTIERLLGRFGVPGLHPPEPIGDAVHVRVDADVLPAPVCQNH